MKKIHFSNVNFSSSSGPNTFAWRLAESLSRKKYKIVDKNEDYDIFLCFIEPASQPRPNKKFILRLDGIWFKPDEFKTHNKNIKWAYDNCNHVIWQSNFDKEMTEKWWLQRSGSIIQNGIKLEKIKNIHPEIAKIRNKFNKIFICSANWHRQKRLKENISFFKKNSTKEDALFILGDNPDDIIYEENIFYLGSQPHDICLQFYSISDWFIHLAWLDHCPNVVVEAISQGCPVICTDSGGTHEIVKNNGIVIPENKKYKYELLDYDNPFEIKIEKINLKNIDINCDYLDIDNISKKYIEVFS